jgi:hypothetical protein
MNTRWIAAAACLLVVGASACAKTDDADDNVTADTSLVPGTEEVETTVPTTDTVVTRTETDVDTDTIEGEARDTIRR